MAGWYSDVSVLHGATYRILVMHLGHDCRDAHRFYRRPRKRTGTVLPCWPRGGV